MHLTGSAAPLQEVWVSLRSSIREVLERVTIADVVNGELPAEVLAKAKDADAWARR